MAQERLQIRLDAVDNTRRAFNSFQNRLDKIKSSIFYLLIITFLLVLYKPLCNVYTKE